MALSVVSRREGWGDSSTRGFIETDTAANHAAGRLLVALISRYLWTSGGISAVEDTGLSTWHPTGIEASQGLHRFTAHYAYNIPGHATNKVKATFAGGDKQWANIAVYEIAGDFSGGDPFIDGEIGSGTSTGSPTADGNVISTPTIDIAGAAQAIVLALMEADGQSLVGGSGWTLTKFNGGSGNGNYFADEYKVVSANTAVMATAGSGLWGAVGVAFRERPSAGNSLLRKMLAQGLVIGGGR